MTKKNVLLFILLFAATGTFAQDCDCKGNFLWVKKTFEENDAGFQYALKTKGTQAYEDHNKRFLEKVEHARKLSECTTLLYEWLKFFRSGHIAITPAEQVQQPNAAPTVNRFADWETYPIKAEDFKQYLDKKQGHDYEGIWETEPYQIGIKKEGDQYIGFIVESGAPSWTRGQVKLKFNTTADKEKAVFYLRDHSPVESGKVTLTGKNYLQIGNFSLKRIYPKLNDDPKYEQYFKALKATGPYLESLNPTTLYLRIPSFESGFKRSIDSVLKANRQKILSTKNLIIDIRNNGGGSDAAYREIIPYLYTNPVRTVGVEFLSTKLNNQRMLDFINKPEYGFDDEGKKWARKAYEQLEAKLGQFVNLNDKIVSENKKDTVYPYPQNVGVIINEANGSTSEQFLLEAKQSKKVKLFGVTTYGVLDISNMYFVDAPSKEFQLGYSLSRSMRIPDFTIDEKGLQPDIYLDRSIPQWDWTLFVSKILNGK
ncbi:MAG TPA: S41 family peptidase [Sediminibacterium sp.]|nr:S41 family peptidase [Sediminibacterium sp.]